MPIRFAFVMFCRSAALPTMVTGTLVVTTEAVMPVGVLTVVNCVHVICWLVYWSMRLSVTVAVLPEETIVQPVGRFATFCVKLVWFSSICDASIGSRLTSEMPSSVSFGPAISTDEGLTVKAVPGSKSRLSGIFVKVGVTVTVFFGWTWMVTVTRAGSSVT